jgi:hypothetical protein
LLNLTQWAWSALKAMTTNGLTGPEVNLKEDHAHIQDLSRIVFVCRVSMRLLRFYILELYPVKSTVHNFLSFVPYNIKLLLLYR